MKHRLLMYAIFVVSLALSTTVNASIATFNFQATVNDTFSDFYGETGVGTVSYETDMVTDLQGLYDPGWSYLYPDAAYWDLYMDPGTFVLSLDFTVFGQTFSTASDADFPDYPELGFYNGDLDYMTLFVSETGVNGTPINQAGIDSFGFGFDVFEAAYGSPFTLNDNPNYDYQLDMFVDGVVVSAVPVPAAAWLFGTGLLGLIGFGRRKKNQA